MLDFLTADRATFYARAESRLAAYGRALLRAEATGGDAEGLLLLTRDLLLGLDVVKGALSPRDDARTAEILAYLVREHGLTEAPLSPYQPLATTLNAGGGGSGGAGGSAGPFGLTPTRTEGGIVAGVPLFLSSEELWIKSLVQYQSPGFTSFLLGGAGSQTVEAGTAFAAGFKSFTWATSNGANVTPASIGLRDVTAAADLATGEANDGVLSAGSAAFVAVPGLSRTYRLSALNSLNAVFSADIIISGAYRLFFGPGPATTGAAIRALAGSQLAPGGGSGTLNTGTTATVFTIVLPPGRTLTGVTDLDSLNANLTSAYVPQPTISVPDAGGVPVPGYTPYVLSAAIAYSATKRHAFTYA